MKYLSVCSGIAAASVAWYPLGFSPVAFAEVEPFPCAVLAERWPGVPNLGDMTQINGRKLRGTVELLVGGTPCQGFSVAGKRKGLADERSGLALNFVRLVEEIKPQWVVWENVPGAFSTASGRDFGTFLRALDGIGYRFAWRVLDAQFFGVPQRRRRIFLVGNFGNWRGPAAVLFESGCLRRDTAESKKKRAGVTQALAKSFGTGGPDDNRAQGGFYVPQIVEQAMSCKWSKGTSGPAGDEHHNLIAGPLNCRPYADNVAQESRLALAVRTAQTSANGCREDGLAYTLEARAEVQALAVQQNQSGDIRHSDVAYTLGTNTSPSGRNTPMIQTELRVRRLTPLECERLQGFPDHYTRIAWRGKSAENCPDAPRYKALGNSMAVPVMRWIGERIKALADNRICAYNVDDDGIAGAQEECSRLNNCRECWRAYAHEQVMAEIESEGE